MKCILKRCCTWFDNSPYIFVGWVLTHHDHLSVLVVGQAPPYACGFLDCLLPPPQLSRPSDELFQSPTGRGSILAARLVSVHYANTLNRFVSNLFHPTPATHRQRHSPLAFFALSDNFYLVFGENRFILRVRQIFLLFF